MLLAEFLLLKRDVYRSRFSRWILRKMDSQHSISVIRRNLGPHGRLWDGEASSKSFISLLDSLKSLTVFLWFSFSRDDDNTPIKLHAYLVLSDTRELNFNNELVFALDDVDRRLPIRFCWALSKPYFGCKIVRDV
jgi:hypothetical protein